MQDPNSPFFSVEAEQHVLSAVLTDPNCLDDVLELIEVGDFYRVDHQRIFSEVIRQRESGNAVDVVTLIAAMGDGDHPDDCAYAVELCQNAIGGLNARTYAQIVLDRARKRRLKHALEESTAFLADGENDTDEAIEYAQSRLIELDSHKFASEIQDANTVLKRVIHQIDDRFRQRNSGQIGGLSTGLESLDARFDGFRPGHLIVLAARPSMGKTALAMQIAQHAAINQRKSVLVFSLEMPTDEIFERAISAQGILPYERLRTGGLLEDDWVKLAAATAKIKDCALRCVDTPGLHINQLRAYARKAHRREPLSLVVVDHMNIMRGDGGGNGKNQNREREVASISWGLKALAKELNCPVLALCQLNRGVEGRADKRPVMSDLRESGAIEQDADIISFLYRYEYYHEDSPNKGVVEVITRKFRGGSNGTDYLANRLDVMRMENFAPSYYAEQRPKQKSREFDL